MPERCITKSALVGLLVATVGCGQANSGTPSVSPMAACPRNGVVVAEARDVERDAEGVSYSVFGEYPTREADWVRAGAVLGLLEDVWATTTKKCSALPSETTDAIDAALSTLDTAIPAQDQQSAAYAGNDVHLAMTGLFQYFNPETPVEIVRMDATFLRAGIDAHFGDWSAYADDLASLQTDWAALKAAAEAKAPTCHRVAGTESVVGDVDDTLAAMGGAGGSDAVTIEREADAGLLEVDILELLFDCPVDGVAPSSGLGSQCSAKNDCQSGEVCDLANAGGRCAPDPTSTNVGASCATTIDCGNDPRDACNNEAGDGYPGGYCTMEPCNDVQVCSPGATCVSQPFETPACMQSCTTDSDCRVGEGYVCQLFPSSPPSGFGPSDHACSFPCGKDEDCTTPLKCGVPSGKCVP